MWRTLSRHRNIAWRSLQLSRRSKSEWRTPPSFNTYESEAERFKFVRFLWRHKPTVLRALLLTYQEYRKQENLSDESDPQHLAVVFLFTAQAAHKQYDQVDFDDPIQNIAYFERLVGIPGLQKTIDKIPTGLENDSHREEVYNLCRQAATSTHSALAKFEVKQKAEVAQVVWTILTGALEALVKFEQQRDKSQ